MKKTLLATALLLASHSTGSAQILPQQQPALFAVAMISLYVSHCVQNGYPAIPEEKLDGLMQKYKAVGIDIQNMAVRVEASRIVQQWRIFGAERQVCEEVKKSLNL